MASTISPGFITLHGNQLEQLRDAVFGWLRENPLEPLEQEIFLVQSNGVAEWLKISLAEHMSVYASTRISLPARFLWESYRAMLGAAAVAGKSAFDRGPLTWRLMTLMPKLTEQSVFAPLKQFLQQGEVDRRLQLAEKIADLYDQYQVYRADWLRGWADGQDTVTDGRGEPVALPPDQKWQAHLWRAVADSVPAAQRQGGRADVHRAFLDAAGGDAAASTVLPRRVVLFGISALPFQTLEALAALSHRTQVILAVPNPSQFYWGDVISGRELLTAERKRQQQRGGSDLAHIPFEQMHQHCHPLLAAWGRLGRDFIRLLDTFDDVQKTRTQFSSLRIDLFSTEQGSTMLSQMQGAIRDLMPLAEHDFVIDADDTSICFHIAHSAQREVEILHDQLLTMLAADGGEPEQGGDQTTRLRPRDIVVMVPDIEPFAPAIRALFGQYAPHDRRTIPFEIVDTAERRINPLLVALDWLLRLPNQRCLQSEIRDLLDVPAIAARFGIAPDDLPRVAQWIDACGIRWGLDEAHRSALHLGPAGEQNSWLFGVRRMLLGYASGPDRTYLDIEPFAQIGGLDAALAGALAALVETLIEWRALLAQSADPRTWGERARALCEAFFVTTEDRDRLTMSRLDQALSRWLENCDDGGFIESVPVMVLREAWLGSFDEATLNQRFVSGGVTFCTLMPMRAVPYRVVCLLGMNEGDFPRRTSRADFDLLALPGMARPGDRSRRDDDRYLMLEAVLSARDRLYISWVGRSVRDNSVEPPSVLVSQLRDYLSEGWKVDLAQRTYAHPLQPFSRRYFEQGGAVTFAREWRTAHAAGEVSAIIPSLALSVEVTAPLSLADLERFIKQPVTQFFRQRLKVDFRDAAEDADDDEPFVLAGLDSYQLDDFLLADSGSQESVDEVPLRLRQRAQKLAREGRLPIGQLGALWQKNQVEALIAPRTAWITLSARFAAGADRFPVAIDVGGVTVEDWLDNVRRDGERPVWLTRTSSTISQKSGKQQIARADKMVGGFVRQVTLGACGHSITGYLVGRDAIVEMPPMQSDVATVTLSVLLSLWQQGMTAPLPTAFKTALALLGEGSAKPGSVYDGTEAAGHRTSAERDQPALARLWPDYAALESASGFAEISAQLYAPLLAWTQTLTVHALDAFDQPGANDLDNAA